MPIRPGNRRRFLQATGAALLGTAFASQGAEGGAPLASFDREMEGFMQARGIPGGALAIARQGKLIYARGYGWADRERKLPVQPGSLFRLASVSKPVTAIALLRLAQQGRLKLDEPAFARLNLAPLPGSKPDARLEKITVRQLLQHTGGWDRDRSGDPMFMPEKIARSCGTASPATAKDIIRYMLGQPLDFDPGTRNAYSNFGYCVLGRLIEAITGTDYEAWVKKDVLAAAGISAMRLGQSLANEAAQNEVRYYMADEQPQPSVFARAPGKVAAPYGSFYLEAMDAHGGWIASAVDLMRLAVALDRPVNPLIEPKWFQAMTAPPAAPVARKPDGTVTDAYYGCGWMVRPVQTPAGFNLWHSGSLPGTATLLVRLSNGMSWAALFNQRREKPGLPDGDIDGALHRAAAKVNDWPEEDWFRKL